MKKFKSEKFCEKLVELRKETTQVVFAEKLGINRSTLSLLETGKQTPSLDILNKVCNLSDTDPNDYFVEEENDGLIYLMGTLEENDRVKINNLMEKIRIKEKYEVLSRRC